MKRTLLVTGPTETAADYVAAAEGSGWEAVEYTLLEVRTTGLPAEALTPRPDWICVTSKYAARALSEVSEELGELPCAVLGKATAERVAALGFDVRLEPTSTSLELAELLAQEVPRPARILWPRSNLSLGTGRDLAELLRASGFDVVDPVVYETCPREDRTSPPPCTGVFFASPSAIERFRDLKVPVGVGTIGIAIGPTTLEILERELGDRFSHLACLLEPSPAALRSCLESIQSEEREP